MSLVVSYRLVSFTAAGYIATIGSLVTLGLSVALLASSRATLLVRVRGCTSKTVHWHSGLLECRLKELRIELAANRSEK